MTAPLDAIVVGGGHNGLVTAAYLAKAGRRTLVLEHREEPGGAAELALTVGRLLVDSHRGGRAWRHPQRVSIDAAPGGLRISWGPPVPSE